jgi:urease accessory protein
MATLTRTPTTIRIRTITRIDGIKKVSADPTHANPPSESDSAKLDDLRLLQLADSALPIGALAHSFGLETLTSADILQVTNLPDFLRAYLEESGTMEAVFCREAFRLAAGHPQDEFVPTRWLDLNHRLSALKPARESRSGSASLGRNFLNAVAALGDFPPLPAALAASHDSRSAVHHSLAFGLAAGALNFPEDRAILAYLHLSAAALVSACQRLLPLGQSHATRILWELKPFILEASSRSSALNLDSVCSFTPLLDWAAMEHPALATRLFIS